MFVGCFHIYNPPSCARYGVCFVLHESIDPKSRSDLPWSLVPPSLEGLVSVLEVRVWLPSIRVICFLFTLAEFGERGGKGSEMMAYLRKNFVRAYHTLISRFVWDEPDMEL